MTNPAIQDHETRIPRRSIFPAFDNLSLRPKLLLGLLLIYLVPNLVGIYAYQQQSQSAKQAATTEATHIAQIIALEARQDAAGLQQFVTMLYNNQQGDAEVINLDKRVLVAATQSDVGSVFVHDQNGEVSATLKDGQTRVFTEANTTHAETINQAVVTAIKDDAGKITGAIIVDYTSLFSEMQQASSATIRSLIVLNIIGLFLALIIGQFFINTISRPIIKLKEAATQMGLGRFNTPILVRPSSDEIGTLATSIAKMADQIQNLIGGLEQRVSERTQALERRSTQIRTAAEVGNASIAIHDLDDLLRQTAQLISQRFEFYHTGIFLLDANEEYAVLRAANSEGGQRMLARGHKLEVGHVGIVGNVAQTGQARIALDVGRDAIYFDNPDLPNTRSEIALPIISNGKVIGVLDAQSTAEAAFAQEDATILQIVADLLAAAIENSRLLDESKIAAETARRAYGELTIQAWKDRFKARPIPGYRSGAQGSAVQINENAGWSQEANQSALEGRSVASRDGATLYVPISARGQTIGVIKLEKPNQKQWTELETQAAQSLADQLSGALDSARLYEDSQKQALKERAIEEITSKISGTINMRNMLQTAVEELGRAIPGADVIIQFQSGNETAGSGK